MMIDGFNRFDTDCAIEYECKTRNSDLHMWKCLHEQTRSANIPKKICMSTCEAANAAHSVDEEDPLMELHVPELEKTR
ncbi:hypothetical protein DPMN_169914 [Dreissena polymorpha]|uniref:Uncharacterized protein n=1 Tax=Dreissena polymorpha TaxID=45954 RepID=A0A9D4ICF3_DREPO|nr:hypothetical protein DPMN_169914 [Dreissena polymorpha]